MVMFCCGRSKVKVPELPDFNASRYLGQWYEIARLDHPFERNMQRVVADYSLRHDGKIQVINRGYRPDKNRWKEAKAVAIQTSVKNFLKVYFIPFIGGSYRIAYVDPDYSIAVVSGGNLRYLWLLARTAHPSAEQIDTMLAEARKLGYDTHKLIYPEQE